MREARASLERSDALPASAVSGPDQHLVKLCWGYAVLGLADYTSRSRDGIGARTRLEEPASGQHHQAAAAAAAAPPVVCQLVLSALVPRRDHLAFFDLFWFFLISFYSHEREREKKSKCTLVGLGLVVFEAS